MKAKSAGFTIAELIVAIGVLSLVLIFFILISGQMLVLTAKTQTLDLTVSLAQSKIEELRSTLTIPPDHKDEPKPGYLRTMTSTLIMETGTTTPVRFLRKVTVSVEGPASLGSKRTVLETFIYTSLPQIAFDFPNTDTAFVSSSETFLHGWLRDDGYNIPANQVTYQTSSNQGESWTSTTAVSGIYTDFACTNAASTILEMGRTYYFQFIYNGGTNGTEKDILVLATNESGYSSNQPNGPQALSSWIRLIADAIEPNISLTTTPSMYISSSFSAENTASDIRSGIRDVFLVVNQSGTSTYWDETVLDWVSGGPIDNYAEQSSGDSHSGIWQYPPTLSPSIMQAFNTAISSCAPGTMLDVQAFALDSVIGKKYDYRNLIPMQGANLPWLNVNANFQTSNLVNLKKIAAPSVTVSIPAPISYTSATLQGLVNPNGAPTDAWFEWGTNESYGFSTPQPSENVGSGLADQPIASPLIGLSPGTTYYFRLAASNIAGTSYSTPASFSTLGGSGIIVTAPNGGENWSIGSTHAIAWISNGVSGDVKIELSRDSGATWTETIASGVSVGSGSYLWTVTGTASAACRVQVSSLSPPGMTDSSDNDFTIREGPDITLTSPVGGEAWSVGSDHNITWSSVSISGNVKIELSRNEGSTWIELASIPCSSGAYSWAVTSPPSATCRIQVTSSDNPAIFDSSASNFSIVSPPSITVVSPNGGDSSWWIGSNQTIAWTSNGISGNVEIHLSRDGGSSYDEVIAASIPCSPGSYNWTPIGPASSNCKIKITSITTPSISDTSDNTFVIPAASITITNPDGGKWKSGKTYSIQGTSLYLGGNVKIELSRDNGATYTVIAASVPILNNTFTFSWIVTNPVASNCKIKVTSLTDPLINKVSVSFEIH